MSSVGGRFVGHTTNPVHQDAHIIADAVGRLARTVEIDLARSAHVLLSGLPALGSGNTIALPAFNEFALVTDCAEYGARPTWRFGSSTSQPRIGRNGKPVVVGKRFGSGRYSEGSHCPLSWTPTVEQIARGRAAYAVWHSALTKLVPILKGKLQEHEAIGPIAPACPWNSHVLADTAAV